jgi:hypothetical protein
MKEVTPFAALLIVTLEYSFLSIFVIVWWDLNKE